MLALASCFGVAAHTTSSTCLPGFTILPCTARMASIPLHAMLALVLVIADPGACVQACQTSSGHLSTPPQAVAGRAEQQDACVCACVAMAAAEQCCRNMQHTCCVTQSSRLHDTVLCAV